MKFLKKKEFIKGVVNYYSCPKTKDNMTLMHDTALFYGKKFFENYVLKKSKILDIV